MCYNVFTMRISRCKECGKWFDVSKEARKFDMVVPVDYPGQTYDWCYPFASRCAKCGIKDTTYCLQKAIDLGIPLSAPEDYFRR